MTEHLSGQCLCGAISYSAETSDTKHYVCHCADCRRYGGGAVHAGVVVAANCLSVSGNPRVWTMTADSGRSIARHFCGDCGGHLFTSPWPAVTRLSIKAGTLDDPQLFRPDAEIWCKSRVGWSNLPQGSDTFDEGFTQLIAIGMDED